MDPYVYIQKIQLDTELTSCAHHLSAFAQITMNRDDKETILECLYQTIHSNEENLLAKARNKGKGYCIFIGNNAVNAFLSITIPDLRDPDQTLKEIINYAHQLLEDFVESPREPICATKAEEIMQYLDKRYNFSKKVFGNKIARIIILDEEDKNANAYFGIQNSSNGNEPIFVLLAKHINCDSNPVSIFFHELGHAVHAKITGDPSILPGKLVKNLESTYIPRISDQSPRDVAEILADVFAIGMIHESPFGEYDDFQIPLKIKNDFQQLTSLYLLF